MTYKIVKGDTIQELTDKVNANLSAGFIPIGGITAIQGTIGSISINWVAAAPTGKHNVKVTLVQAMTYEGN